VSPRLFVALDLPDAALAALAAFRDAAADPAVWRPLPDDRFHVTLGFLGHRSEADAEAAAAVLAALPAHPAPSLSLGAGLLLPPRRARVLTVALADPGGGLGRLQAAVAGGLVAAALYEEETRPFRPHVTVARVRPGARAPASIDVVPRALAFTAGSLVLYRSRTQRGGALYEPLARRRLR